MAIPMADFAQTKLKWKVTIARVSATTVYVETEAYYVTGFIYVPSPQSQISTYSSLVTVSNMDTTNIILKFTGDGAVASDITEQYLRVKLVKHVNNI